MRAAWPSSAVLLLLLVACGGAAGDADTVVVYSAHDLLFSEPILAEFERRTGLDVRVVGDTEASKTVGLVNRLLARRARPEADVFWNNEALNAVRLAELGLLQPFSPPSAADVPAAQRDPADRWVGFAARARVLLYDTRQLTAAEAPRALSDLLRPELRGRVAIASPLFGTSATHAAVLFHVLGPERAREFYRALLANGCKVVPGNAQARDMVVSGAVAVCLTDTDDANGALGAGREVAMVYPDQDGLGALVIPNTVMLIAGAPHAEAGRRLVDFLASREVEELLARSEAAQLPLRPGIAPHDERFDLATVRAMQVDWAAAARAWPECVEFLREAFLR
jgi:iron(III) transport system substrate-binding protein